MWVKSVLRIKILKLASSAVDTLHCTCLCHLLKIPARGACGTVALGLSQLILVLACYAGRALTLPLLILVAANGTVYAWADKEGRLPQLWVEPTRFARRSLALRLRRLFLKLARRAVLA